LSRLPILISIPHGGRLIPEDLQKDIMISPLDVLEDSDAFTHEIYDMSDHAEYVYKADIARAVIDLNRSVDQIPPEFPDGIIKSHTCYGKQIYKQGRSPGKDKTESLIQSYYVPYHTQINDVLTQNPHIKLALDCHSMASVGPQYSKDKGKKRPLMCLGNVWGKTCSALMINQIATYFCQSFGFQSSDIRINEPFSGGYITQTYGMGPVPWIQVEISRALYLTERYFDSQTLQININRLHELNRMFKMGLMLYLQKTR